MKYYVLVDCNNFYASCERLFNPWLEKRPVIVLSNNDGCVVARSQEAKKLGIKMGEPFFKIKEACERLKIVVCSSNYALYGDLSRRVMHLLSQMAEEIQIYSIDEAFLTFSHMPVEELLKHCAEIRRKVKQWVGIPISIGIATSKTLAKVATSIAKKESSGLFAIASQEMQESILRQYPIEDVWGIGSNLKKRLYGVGIRTAWEYQAQDPGFIRKVMGVVGERMLWELRGVSCLPLEKAEDKKSITSSRSFGSMVTTLEELSEALANYVNTASVKLRSQKSCARSLCVFVEGAFDEKTGSRSHDSRVLALTYPTNDTPQLIAAAKFCLGRLFCEGQRYKKCGVILLDLIPEAQVIPDLFLGGSDPKRRQVAQLYDAVNERYGKNTLFYGAMGIERHWKMRNERCSDNFTTSWTGLAIAKA